MSQKLVFALSEPVTIVLSGMHGPKREEQIVSVSLREIGPDDLLLLDRFRHQPATLALQLVAGLSGLTVSQAKRLAIADYATIADAAMARLATTARRMGIPTEWFREQPAV